MAKQPWKTWDEVVKLRDDLRSGDLPLHIFAADLYEVMMQNTKRPIYERPDEFFAPTFPTHNLRGLVRDVVLRLAGKNDKAVRQLELTYGGGKTHTLITTRRLVNDPAGRIGFPATIRISTACPARAGFGRELFGGRGVGSRGVDRWGWFVDRRLGDGLPRQDQEVGRQAVRKHAKAVGQRVMMAQPIRTQRAFPFFVAVLAFSPFPRTPRTRLAAR